MSKEQGRLAKRFSRLSNCVFEIINPGNQCRWWGFSAGVSTGPHIYGIDTRLDGSVQVAHASPLQLSSLANDAAVTRASVTGSLPGFR
jgi:hypothetical protein